MKRLDIKAMSHILAGTSDHTECEELIIEGNLNKDNPDFDWDDWGERFEEICGTNDSDTESDTPEG